MIEVAINPVRYGSSSTPRVAIPTAAERLNGRQQASVDNAVRAAATGMILVESFMMRCASFESPHESIHNWVRLGASHLPDTNGNSRQNEMHWRIPVQHLSHRLEQWVIRETRMSWPESD